MAWKNQPLTLYHGTSANHVEAIQKKIKLDRSRDATDFGRGFYTTPSLDFAHRWAKLKENPAILRFSLDRKSLANLCILTFPAPLEETNYGDFVSHCRRRGFDADHRYADGGYYDIVMGPMVKADRIGRPLKEKGRCLIESPGHDQVSFHTENAITALRFVESFSG